MDWMPQAVRDGILVILIVSGPIVILAAAIGLVVGILQAATQVQEQTIGSAVKIIGVFAFLIVTGYWMLGYMNQYTQRTFNTAFTFVPKQSKKVLSSKASLYGNTPGEVPGEFPKLPALDPLPQSNPDIESAYGPGGTNVLGSRKPDVEPLTESINIPSEYGDEDEEELGIDEESEEGYQMLIPLE